MTNDHTPEIRQEIELVLADWRGKALQSLFGILLILGLVGLVIQISTDIQRDSFNLWSTIVFVLGFLGLILLKLWGGIDYRMQGWGMLMILFLVGIASMVRGGLMGDGRLILFILPFLAVILVGKRAMYWMAFLDVGSLLAFTFFASLGLLEKWGLKDLTTNPYGLSNWTIEGMYSILILLVALPVLVFFTDFVSDAIEQERRSQLETRKAHELLDEYNQKLEQMVEKRTIELEQANQEAQEARQTAEIASQAKSAFLANISHEIRTPMNAVIGMTSMLHETPLTRQQADYADAIQKSSETLLFLINDILDFSKIEAGRMELNRSPFSVQHCIDNVLEIMTPKASEKALLLTHDMQPDVPESILGDEDRLRQVLMNLVDNAIKFTHEGQVAITIQAQPPTQINTPSGARDSQILTFSVQDSGIGIPPDRISQLYMPFNPGDNSRTRRSEGVGLGLAISKRLVEMMDGKIWVESQEGQGTTFKFTIQAEPAPSPRATIRSDGRPDLSDKRILILADHTGNRRILTFQVQAWNMTPRATGDPHEAIQWLRQGEQFFAAVIDLDITDEALQATLNEIRRAPAANNLRIILFTEDVPTAVPELPGTILLQRNHKASFLYNALIDIFGEKVEFPFHQDTQRLALFDSKMANHYPLNILMVEDNIINQNLITLMLERLGYRPDLASNGLEALQALYRQTYSVILMDVQMPEMDGLEATRRIRQEFPADQQPYIIALTAHVMNGDREICLAAGMDDYISKPIHIEELVNSLKHTAQFPGMRLPLIPSADAASPSAESGSEDLAANPDSDGPPVSDQIDLEHLKKRLGSRDVSMLPTLISSFFKQAEKLIEELAIAIHANDAAETQRLAHSLKSNSANFGANRLANLAQQMELRARQKSLVNASADLDIIKIHYSLAKDALLLMQKDLQA